MTGMLISNSPNATATTKLRRRLAYTETRIFTYRDAQSIGKWRSFMQSDSVQAPLFSFLDVFGCLWHRHASQTLSVLEEGFQT